MNNVDTIEQSRLLKAQWVSSFSPRLGPSTFATYQRNFNQVRMRGGPYFDVPLEQHRRPSVIDKVPGPSRALSNRTR